MKVLLLLLLSLISSFAIGQKTFFVADEITLDPIPFVKIIPNEGQPILADLDGIFSLEDAISSFTLRYNGYQDTVLNATELKDSAVILMHLSTQQLAPVTVLPGINPAHRIMRNAIAKRKNNHPIKHDAFRYKSYSKFLFDVDPDFVASIPEDTDDSTLIRIRNFSDSMHLFLMESVSERYFEPPLRDQERVIGYKISGLSDPRFSTFAKGLQSFSFYDNQFEVFGRQYVNPLALGGLNRYLFALQDTIINPSDTTYMIYFRPKTGKLFDGIEGYLYINTNQFAIEKVVAAPHNDSTGISVKIVQEYAFMENRRWFPVKLSTEIDLGDLIGAASGQPNGPAIIGTGYTNIEEVTFDPERVKWRESSVALFSDPDANELSETEWKTLRQTEITEKESNTYTVIDSISQELNFERVLNAADVLLEGKVPLGYVNLDLRRIYRFNYFERHRIGLGLETSKKLLKPVTVGGYFAYGTGDKDWKYGGYTYLHLWRKQQMRLELRYQEDVLERGGTVFQAGSSTWLNPDSYRNFFISSMDRQRIAEVAFRTDIRSNLSVRFSQNYQRISFTQAYRFLPTAGTDLTGLDIAEAVLDVEWNPFARYQVFGERKLATTQKFPKVRMKAAHGWKGLGESSLEYWRFNASLTHQVKIARIVTLDWKVTAAQTFGDVPLFLTHTGDGTRIDWIFSTPGSFETMPPATFFSTEQVSAFARFKFRAFRTRGDWNEPQISLHHAWGIGSFNNRSLHTLDFSTLNKGYGEFGFILDGIIVRQFSGLGLGLFYNYSPAYSSPVWHENIVPKISISFVVN